MSPSSYVVDSFHNLYDVTYEVGSNLQTGLITRISRIIIPILLKFTPDTITLLLYLFITLCASIELQYTLFQEIIITLILIIGVEMTLEFHNTVSALFVILHLSIFFIFLQTWVEWIPKKYTTRAIARCQFVYANTMVVILQTFLQNDFIAIFVLISAVAAFKVFGMDNNNFFIMFSMAASQV